MFTRRLILFLLLLLILSGSQVYAQSDDLELPIVFVTETEILKWTGTDEFIHVADMPAPTYEVTSNRSRLVWRDLVASPDLHYVAYAVVTPEWQDVIGNNGIRDGERVATNIYIVDIATGETKPVVLQTTAEPRQQTFRWGLDWSTDSQTLFWLEDAEAGNLIGYDLETSTFTTLVENAAPYYSLVRMVTDDRIVLNDLSAGGRVNDYTIYTLDGTLISHIGALESTEDFAYSYTYIDGDQMYLGTNVERVNLETGEISEMPGGSLLSIAANAPETSLRVTPAEFGDQGCFSNLLTSDGEVLSVLPVNNPYDFSPDGSAILYLFPNSNSYVIASLNADGTLSETRLPELSGFAYLVQWGARSSVLEVGGDAFYGATSCGAG